MRSSTDRFGVVLVDRDSTVTARGLLVLNATQGPHSGTDLAPSGRIDGKVRNRTRRIDHPVGAHSYTRLRPIVVAHAFEGIRRAATRPRKRGDRAWRRFVSMNWPRNSVSSPR